MSTITGKPASLEAKRVQDRLTTQGLRWADLGASLYASDQALYNWRTRGIPKPQLKPVAQFLGCSVDWLITGDKDAVDMSCDQAFLVTAMNRGMLPDSGWKLLRTMAEALMQK